jgi:putative hydrolase of the HAD superfamily
MTRSTELDHVRVWVFDLDNTLYCPSVRLFDQVNAKITAYVVRALDVDEAEAAEIRSRYWREHGTTLAGLMAHHAVDPEHYLDDVHAIDLSAVAPDHALRAAIDALPGRKVIYTNGSRGHGRGVAAALGLSDCFEAIYGVEDAGYAPKPRAEAFARVFGRIGFDPAQAAMVEDDQRNLEVPARLGMATIWRPADPDEPQAAHVRHVARDLAAFLREAASPLAAPVAAR